MTHSIIPFLILTAVFFLRPPYILLPEDVVNTTCTFTGITTNITFRITEDGPIADRENYYLTLTTTVNKSIITIDGITNYEHDQKLINHTFPCYFVKGSLKFEEPYICDNTCEQKRKIELMIAFALVAVIVGLLIKYTED